MDELSDKVHVAILGSGYGSNARELLRYGQASARFYRVVLVISSRSQAGICQVAHEFGVPVEVVSPRQYCDQEMFGEALLSVLSRYNVECIALAGYLVKVPDIVVARYRNRILNIHPALLPKFGGKGMYGINIHRAVLDAGEKWSGVTIHLVTEEYDDGPILEQVKVPIIPSDTPESLMQRVQTVEHALYPQVLERFSLQLLLSKQAK